MITIIFLVLKIALLLTVIYRILTRKNKDITMMYCVMLYFITQLEMFTVL